MNRSDSKNSPNSASTRVIDYLSQTARGQLRYDRNPLQNLPHATADTWSTFIFKESDFKDSSSDYLDISFLRSGTTQDNDFLAEANGNVSITAEPAAPRMGTVQETAPPTTARSDSTNPSVEMIMQMMELIDAASFVSNCNLFVSKSVSILARNLLIRMTPL